MNLLISSVFPLCIEASRKFSTLHVAPTLAYWIAMVEKWAWVSNFLFVTFRTLAHGGLVFLLEHHRVKSLRFGLEAASFSWIFLHQFYLFIYVFAFWGHT